MSDFANILCLSHPYTSSCMGLRNLSRAWSSLIPYPNRVLIQLSTANVVDIQRGLRTERFRSRVSILGKD